MRKTMDRDAEVKVIFKVKNNDGDHEDMTIGDIDIKTAHKIYKKLIHQWKTKKVVRVPTHAVTIASDAIFMIAVRE